MKPRMENNGIVIKPNAVTFFIQDVLEDGVALRTVSIVRFAEILKKLIRIDIVSCVINSDMHMNAVMIAQL